MSFASKRIRTIFATAFAVTAVSLASIMPLHADDSTLLSQIVTNTNPIPSYTTAVLAFVNNTLTNYITNIAGPAFNNLIATDDKDQNVITNFQAAFIPLDNALYTGSQAAINGYFTNPQNPSQQTPLFKTPLPTMLFTDPDTGNPISTTNSNINTKTMDYTNLATPPSSPTDTSAQNYIANTAGLNLYHTVYINWPRGSATDQKRYSNYYNTIMSIQSYNAYVLSEMYANQINPNGIFTTAQVQLINLASNATTWFAKIAAENIGNVLRQILMFESQSYILQTEMLKTQKEMLYAQAMTNTAIIATNTSNENTLINRAKGTVPPGG